MANMRIAAAVRNSMLNVIRNAIDAGGGAGTLKIYGDTQPTNGDTAIGSQTLLATLTFSDPSASDASGGVLTFSVITEDSAADATEQANWARIEDSTGAEVFDCDVTATGGGGTIELNTVAIVTGGPVQITSFTVTFPAV
jgi:hypothetical protein